MQHIDLTITGMSCAHCIARVSKALHGVVGLTIHNVRTGAARVSYDPAVVSLDTVHQVVTHAGYEITTVQAVDGA